MLAGFKSGDDLLRVEMMASRNQNRVHRRMVENLLFVRGAGTESKFFRGMIRVGTARCAGDHHFDGASSFDHRQQRACYKVTATEKADLNGLMPGDRPIRGRQVHLTAIISSIRICDEGAKERLMRFSGDQIIG